MSITSGILLPNQFLQLHACTCSWNKMLPPWWTQAMLVLLFVSSDLLQKRRALCGISGCRIVVVESHMKVRPWHMHPRSCQIVFHLIDPISLHSLHHDIRCYDMKCFRFCNVWWQCLSWFEQHHSHCPLSHVPCCHPPLTHQKFGRMVYNQLVYKLMILTKNNTWKFNFCCWIFAKDSRENMVVVYLGIQQVLSIFSPSSQHCFWPSRRNVSHSGHCKCRGC